MRRTYAQAAASYYARMADDCANRWEEEGAMPIPTRVTIACPMSHRDGWSCDGELTVEVTGRYVPARGFDPPEYPTYNVLFQTCNCDPLAIDALRAFDDRVEAALREKGER